MKFALCYLARNKRFIIETLKGELWGPSGKEGDFRIAYIK